MGYLKTFEDMTVKFTDEQLTLLKSFNREWDKEYHEILFGKFSYISKPDMEPGHYAFYEFPKVDTEHLEYMGWKKSKKYKNCLEKGFYTIHVDKKYMVIHDERQWHDEKCIYDGNVPNTEEFLVLLKLLNIE